MRPTRRRLLLAPLALGVAAAADPRRAPAADAPERRTRAARRGLDAIYRSAQVPKNFADHGDDYLWAFYNISVTAADPVLASAARRMGQRCALAWRRSHPVVPPDANSDQVYEFAGASRCADRLGAPDERMHDDLARAATRFKAEDFFWFDPAREPPPDDVPDTCGQCGRDNVRGRRTCAYCGAQLDMQSPYDVLSSALIVAFVGESYGVRLGAGYPEVTGLLPRMRPYRGYEGGDNPDFESIAYAVTHIVYTLNDYSALRLRPDWLPDEFAFLKQNISANIQSGDGELLGEFMDSLKGFGVGDQDPDIERASRYLLRTQHRDGSWGDGSPYHPTWTAVDGLRDYAFQREGASFPAALARARG
ncbi:MAG: hypothetical protein ACHP84_01570 [Caulobacterales bacterium]